MTRTTMSSMRVNPALADRAIAALDPNCRFLAGGRRSIAVRDACLRANCGSVSGIADLPVRSKRDIVDTGDRKDDADHDDTEKATHQHDGERFDQGEETFHASSAILVVERGERP